MNKKWKCDQLFLRLTLGVSNFVGHQKWAGSFKVPFVPITTASFVGSRQKPHSSCATRSPGYFKVMTAHWSTPVVAIPYFQYKGQNRVRYGGQTSLLLGSLPVPKHCSLFISVGVTNQIGTHVCEFSVIFCNFKLSYRQPCETWTILGTVQVPTFN